MLRFGAEEMMSLERMEAEEEGGDDSEGEGTGSTELSDIRLLGRCESETDTEGTSFMTDSLLVSRTESVYLVQILFFCTAIILKILFLETH